MSKNTDFSDVEISKLAPLRVRNVKFATHLKFATCGKTNKINEFKVRFVARIVNFSYTLSKNTDFSDVEISKLAPLRVRNVKFAIHLKFATCGKTNKINEFKVRFVERIVN